MKKYFKSLFAFIFAFGLFISFSSINIEAAEKKKYDTWQDVAKDMNVEFQAAKKFIEATPSSTIASLYTFIARVSISLSSSSTFP